MHGHRSEAELADNNTLQLSRELCISLCLGGNENEAVFLLLCLGEAEGTAGGGTHQSILGS